MATRLLQIGWPITEQITKACIVQRVSGCGLLHRAAAQNASLNCGRLIAMTRATVVMY
jgi:hypothetical protein